MNRHVSQNVTRILLAAALVAGLSISAAAGTSGTWSMIANLHNARDGHTATLLPNGNVVVAGGENNNSVLSSTEVFSPTTGAWTMAGNLNVARASASAVLLPAGTVLVAGGCIGGCLAGNTTSAEIYNSVSASWTSTGSMIAGRVYFGMVLLSNGKVLAVGGCTGQNANGCTGVTNAAEIYDPSTGKWASTGAMRAARGALSASLLQSGKVLVAGGINAAGNPIASAELYDPSTGKWTSTGKLNLARDEHTANLLANGNVLIAGGESINGPSINQAELYNPATGKFTLTGKMVIGRQEHTAVLLTNGNVLVSGGNKVTATSTTVLSSAEYYNAATGVWTKTGAMHAARVGHTSTLLQTGVVMNASGSNANNDLVSAETYQP